MALTKETVLDRTEITEDGTLQLRFATYVLEDGVRITDAAYHRRVVEPGDSTAGLPDRVVKVAAAVHTPDVIAAYRNKRAQAAAGAGR